MRTILCPAQTAAILLIANFANASHPFFSCLGNQPYVQSGADGVFYARCLPPPNSKSPGTTTIYKASTKETDADRIDVYPWYAPGRLVIGWSPIAGKVCVMAGMIEGGPGVEPIPLSFYMGGKLLKAYSFEDLEALGIRTHQKTPVGPMAELGLGKWQQIPGTNEYVFTVTTRDNGELRFDILTGELYKEKSP